MRIGCMVLARVISVHYAYFEPKKNSTHYYSLAKLNEALRKQNREKNTHTNQSVSYIIFVYAIFCWLVICFGAQNEENAKFS